MVERIGNVGGIHSLTPNVEQIPLTGPTSNIGRKLTSAVGPNGGIYNIYSPAPYLLTSALSYQIPASISDDIIGAGQIVRNITGVGNFTDVLAGLGTMSRTALLGAVSDLATVGAISYAAGTTASLTAGGATTVTGGGAVTITAGAAVAISAGAAASLTAAGIVTVTGVSIALN